MRKGKKEGGREGGKEGRKRAYATRVEYYCLFFLPPPGSWPAQVHIGHLLRLDKSHPRSRKKEGNFSVREIP